MGKTEFESLAAPAASAPQPKPAHNHKLVLDQSKLSDKEWALLQRNIERRITKLNKRLRQDVQVKFVQDPHPPSPQPAEHHEEVVQRTVRREDVQEPRMQRRQHPRRRRNRRQNLEAFIVSVLWGLLFLSIGVFTALVLVIILI